MARVTFTPSRTNPDWQSFDMLSDREDFVQIIFESQFETTSATRFTLNYSDLTLSFLGVGLTYSFDSFGDVSAITGGADHRAGSGAVHGGDRRFDQRSEHSGDHVFADAGRGELGRAVQPADRRQ